MVLIFPLIPVRTIRFRMTSYVSPPAIELKKRLRTVVRQPQLPKKINGINLRWGVATIPSEDEG